MWRPRSLRVRYTLRALFVFITLFMLWGGYHTNRGWKEREAERILGRHHSGCGYGPKKVGSGWISELRFAYLKLVQLVWRERFITQAMVNAPPEGEVLDAILALPHLEGLSLNPAPSTKEEQELYAEKRIVEAKDKMPAGALERIIARRPLRVLELTTWILSDDDCRAIAECQSLEYLGLFGSQCSEEALAKLVTLPRLRHLRMSHCPVTGAGLASVPGSHSLQVIDCPHAPVGREFAAFVGRSPAVTTLTVWSDSVADDFVAALGSHPSLCHLTLISPCLTDRSALTLQQLPSLQGVAIGPGTVAKLPDGFVTSAAKDRLRAAKPGLVVQ